MNHKKRDDSRVAAEETNKEVLDTAPQKEEVGRHNKDDAIKRKRRIIMVAAVITLYMLLVAGMIFFYRRELADYIAEPEKFREWIDSFGISGRLVYILISAVQVVLAVIYDGPLQAAGGYAFGSLWGSIFFITGFTLGSLASFLLARRFGRMVISLFFSEEKYEKLLADFEGRNLYILVFLLYLIPNTPKDLLTYCFGTTKIRLPYFLLLASAGRLPAVLLTMMIAPGVMRRNLTMIISVVLGAGLLYFAGILIRRHLLKGRERKP